MTAAENLSSPSPAFRDLFAFVREQVLRTPVPASDAFYAATPLCNEGWVHGVEDDIQVITGLTQEGGRPYSWTTANGQAYRGTKIGYMNLGLAGSDWFCFNILLATSRVVQYGRSMQTDVNSWQRPHELAEPDIRSLLDTVRGY